MKWAYCIKINGVGAAAKLQWYYITADSESEAILRVPTHAYGGPLPCPSPQAPS